MIKKRKLQIDLEVVRKSLVSELYPENQEECHDYVEEATPFEAKEALKRSIVNYKELKENIRQSKEGIGAVQENENEANEDFEWVNVDVQMANEMKELGISLEELDSQRKCLFNKNLEPPVGIKFYHAVKPGSPIKA